MKKFISWRRVSTKKQFGSKLGLEAQQDIISYFIEREGGTLIADYVEAYTGTELSGCAELRRAINHCKTEDAVLIIAKSDRFRNTREALDIYEEMGEGRIYFCDLPSSDKFTLTLFFALAERESLIVRIRTKQALDAKRKRGEAMGGSAGQWGKHTNKNEDDRDKMLEYAREKSAESTKLAARNNSHNKAFVEFMGDWQKIYGKVGWRTDWNAIVAELNKRGKRTATGLEFTVARARAMWLNVNKNFKNI